MSIHFPETQMSLSANTNRRALWAVRGLHGQWYRHATGIDEVIGAILLLLPSAGFPAGVGRGFALAGAAR